MNIVSRNSMLLIALFTLTSTSAVAAISTLDLNGQTAEDVAQTMVGPGIVISNVTSTSANIAIGTFAGGTGIIGFEDGVILSSGDISSTPGPNISDSETTVNGTPGDADLNVESAPNSTGDAAVLEFDFVPNDSTVFFRYVFTSDEYNEFVNTQFHDVFAFYVNGINCATIPDGAGTLPVTVSSVNNGNPFGALGTETNPALYINNDLTDGGGAIDTEMDGLTVALTCMSAVNSGVDNHMKLAIADTGDLAWDSNVFLEKGSLSTVPPTDSGKVTGGGRVDFGDGFVNFGTVVISDEQGLRGNLQVIDHRSKTRFHGFSVDTLSVVDKTATWSGAGRLNGEDGYKFTITVVDNRNGNSKKKGSPDTIEVEIENADGTVLWWSTEGTKDLLRGNIKVH
jgi:hypothetical protein